jgi:UDP-N-acetyl-2-amino-2-deoxyglucuronate dehydrogenase
MSNKKIALVGCGRISARHIEAISDTPGLKICCVCDIREDRAKNISETLHVPYVTDYQKITGADVISILTPSGLHPHHTIHIARSTDAPILLVEKPISLTVREAVEMFKYIDGVGKKLLPVYQNRYNPLVAFVKKMINDGKFGSIYQFVCDVFWNRDEKYFKDDWHGTRDLDGGVLFTQASHYVDMIHYFFGDIVETKGIGGSLRGKDVYDTISAVCQFKNGIVGTINATINAYRKNYLTEFTLLGEKGVIRLSGTNLNTIEHWDVEGMEKPALDFTIGHIYGKGHDTMYQYIADERWDMFPSREDILSGVALMERLSY